MGVVATCVLCLIRAVARGGSGGSNEPPFSLGGNFTCKISSATPSFVLQRMASKKSAGPRTSRQTSLNRFFTTASSIPPPGVSKQDEGSAIGVSEQDRGPGVTMHAISMDYDREVSNSELEGMLQLLVATRPG